MSGDVKSRRRYDATRRREQAARTRAEVLATARRLFVARGYAATSVRDIADEAGVAVQTIYDGFGSKAGLLVRLAEVAVVGDDEPIPLADRDATKAVFAAETAEDLVAGFAAEVGRIWERFGDLLPVLRSAAAVEPVIAAEQRDKVGESRHDELCGLVDRLGELGGLRPGLDGDRTTDVIWAVTGPELYEAMVLERGWSTEAYAAWLADALTRLVLDA